MGNLCTGPVGDPDTRARHNEIEKQLRQDRADAERSVKLLLLGRFSAC